MPDKAPRCACQLARWALASLCGMLLGIGQLAQAQNGGSLRVFLDCGRCDESRVRTEIPFVDYVRDPQMADVHIFVTTNFTVLSGRELELSFIGLNEHSRSNITLKRTVPQNSSGEEARTILHDAIRVGLIPFVEQQRLTADFSVVYSGDRTETLEQQLEADPWHHWVFNIYGGDFELDLESNRTVFDSRWGFYADHRSETWKIRVRPYFNYDLVRIKRGDNPTVRSSISRHGLDSYLIRSLGPHWSLGVFGTYLTRNDRNLEHYGSLVPGIEYSLLPYEVATRRAITFVYTLGMAYVDYFEETIFNRIEEWLPRHEIDATVAVRQPWGDIYSGVEASQYLHDSSKQRAEIFTSLSVRLFAGFSLDVEGRFEMIRDQLSLPLGDASLQDVLLQQRELATDYNVSAAIAVSYTFGSSFANVVNTRF
ncbi:MAG: hypothetical protein OXU68_10130 [Bacteroidota bacterium]|nr:hypothetical protein [Bacteroidota bacterium]